MALKKDAVWQKIRNFAPLFGVVRALVRYIECRVRRFSQGEDGHVSGEERHMILARSKASR